MSPVSEAGRSVVLGVDFGTRSGRAVVVAVDNGEELGSAVHEYPHGVLADTLPGMQERLPHDWALQVPSDYVEVLRTAVPKALTTSGVSADDVIGIGTDFTACTVLPTLADGTPLCDLPEFRHRPHAYVKLWRHHAAKGQADRINTLAHSRGEPWIGLYGGKLPRLCAGTRPTTAWPRASRPPPSRTHLPNGLQTPASSRTVRRSRQQDGE
jgi:L-ribulokinase